VLALESLALEFLIEGENGSLGSWSDISGTSTRGEEDAVVGDGGVGSVDLGEGSWGSLGASGTSVVTSTAAASVENGLSWDTVDDLHCESLVGLSVKKLRFGGSGVVGGADEVAVKLVQSIVVW